MPYPGDPPLGDGELVIYPNPDALREVFGTTFDLLRLPMGYRQRFTVVEIDPMGRMSAPATVTWTHTSEAGNEMSLDGVFSANESENPSGVGVEPGGTGLSVTATLEAGGQTAETEPLPIAVFQPVEIPAASAAAIRIFPRVAQVLPGSTIRFVAVLVDENGMLRNIEPPPSDPDPQLPGARWASDGLPIDERTGAFEALYSGETVDETMTITVRDPVSGPLGQHQPDGSLLADQRHRNASGRADPEAGGARCSPRSCAR